MKSHSCHGWQQRSDTTWSTFVQANTSERGNSEVFHSQRTLFRDHCNYVFFNKAFGTSPALQNELWGIFSHTKLTIADINGHIEITIPFKEMTIHIGSTILPVSAMWHQCEGRQIIFIKDYSCAVFKEAIELSKMALVHKCLGHALRNCKLIQSVQRYKSCQKKKMFANRKKLARTSLRQTRMSQRCWRTWRRCHCIWGLCRRWRSPSAGWCSGHQRRCSRSVYIEKTASKQKSRLQNAVRTSVKERKSLL